MRLPLLLIGVVTAALLSACNLTTTRVTEEPIVTEPPATGSPSVTISSPQTGDEFVVGDDIFVSATATDSVGVTSVRLLANGQIVKTVSSEATGGDESLNVLLDYRPTTAGDVTLEVVAFRGAVASEPAVVEISVRQSQAQVTATVVPPTGGPVIDPNDPTCRALTNVALNVRTGPGVNFPRIRVLDAGSVVPITGRVGDNSWWQVRLNSTTSGWVAQNDPNNLSINYISIFGICTGIPVIFFDPTPTPTVFIPPPPPPTWTPPPPPTATPVPGQPDLVVSRIDGPATVTIPVGETSVTESYIVTILNIGSAGTGQFSNTIGIVGQPFIDLGTVGGLSANQAITLTADLSFDTVGTVTVRAIADSDSDVGELIEVNNRGEIDVTVVAGS
jgi:uncharacterized protein YraI